MHQSRETESTPVARRQPPYLQRHGHGLRRNRAPRRWAVAALSTAGLAFLASWLGIVLSGYVIGPARTPQQPVGAPAWGHHSSIGAEGKGDGRSTSASDSTDLRQLILTVDGELDVEIGQGEPIRLSPRSHER